MKDRFIRTICTRSELRELTDLMTRCGYEVVKSGDGFVCHVLTSGLGLKLVMQAKHHGRAAYYVKVDLSLAEMPQGKAN